MKSKDEAYNELLESGSEFNTLEDDYVELAKKYAGKIDEVKRLEKALDKACDTLAKVDEEMPSRLRPWSNDEWKEWLLEDE